MDGLAGDEIERQLAELSGESRNWPDDREFAAAVTGSNFYALHRARQRGFFAGIENHLRDAKAEEARPIRACTEQLNIEHVMPQKWQTHWGLAESASPEAMAARDHAVNSVGNLTLTNGRLNSLMSNEAWVVKRPALQEKSTLLITTASILSAPAGAAGDVNGNWADEWTEHQIHVRGRYLADLSQKVWPRPAIAVVDDLSDDDERDAHDDDEDDEYVEDHE